MCDLNLERSTWELIHVLYSDRINADQMEQDDWDTEPSILTQTVRERVGHAHDMRGMGEGIETLQSMMVVVMMIMMMMMMIMTMMMMMIVMMMTN